jgi:hypothetical protein
MKESKRLFFEKRSKKLLVRVLLARPMPQPSRAKVFCFFFSKKKILPSPSLPV